jgi:hypothetical protein
MSSPDLRVSGVTHIFAGVSAPLIESVGRKSHTDLIKRDTVVHYFLIRPVPPIICKVVELKAFTAA